MVNRVPETNTYKPPRPRDAAPWLEAGVPALTCLRRSRTEAAESFSVCLYDEPAYARRFPNRDRRMLYTGRFEAIREFLDDSGLHLRLFCDAAMADEALRLDRGDVWLVQTPPAFPFHQHLWRYYAALLADQPSIRVIHFRGLDNVADTAELPLLRQFAASGTDILHAPFVRQHTGLYMTVRGSCSVANAGIGSLAWFLRTFPCREKSAPEDWRCDELYLHEWFRRVSRHHSTMTVVDREMPPEFYADLAERFRLALKTIIIRP